MEETTPNEAPATMTNYSFQLHASHEMIVASVVATKVQRAATESEEDTPLSQRNPQKVLGDRFHCGSQPQTPILDTNCQFGQEERMEGIETGIQGLLVHCTKLPACQGVLLTLLIHKRLIKPQQLRQK